MKALGGSSVGNLNQASIVLQSRRKFASQIRRERFARTTSQDSRLLQKERPTRCVKALGGSSVGNLNQGSIIAIEPQICFANSPRALCAHNFSRRSPAPKRKTYAARESSLEIKCRESEPRLDCYNRAANLLCKFAASASRARLLKTVVCSKKKDLRGA